MRSSSTASKTANLDALIHRTSLTTHARHDHAAADEAEAGHHPTGARAARRHRSGAASCRRSWLQAAANKKALPEFKPPKPKVADGLRTMSAVVMHELAKPTFKDSMQKSFVSVGLAEDRTRYPETGFATYRNHQRGTMALRALKDSDESVSFGELVSETEVLSRHAEIAEDEKNDSEIDEEESENEGEEEAADDGPGPPKPKRRKRRRG